MALQPAILEIGTGIDLHGQDYTEAARRAVWDAVHHSSLMFLSLLGPDTSKEMIVDVTVAVPAPDEVDPEPVLAVLPPRQGPPDDRSRRHGDRAARGVRGQDGRRHGGGRSPRRRLSPGPSEAGPSASCRRPPTYQTWPWTASARREPSLHVESLLAGQVRLRLLAESPIAAGTAEVVGLPAKLPGPARRSPSVHVHVAHRVGCGLGLPAKQGYSHVALRVGCVYGLNLLSRSELATTVIELTAMAPAARIGFKKPNSPRAGRSTSGRRRRGTRGRALPPQLGSGRRCRRRPRRGSA